MSAIRISLRWCETEDESNSSRRTGWTSPRADLSLALVRLHYSCDELRDPERNPWLQKERKKYTSQEAWDCEQEIIDGAGGGELVFAGPLVTWWKIVIHDPRWRPDPDWRVEGGFDHGKTNTTSLLRAYHDFDGSIYFAGEYYQPGREIWQHAPALRKMPDFERMDPRYADPSIFNATSQQSERPGQAAERAKSFGELYAEQGLEFAAYRGDLSNVSFAGRLPAATISRPDFRRPVLASVAAAAKHCRYPTLHVLSPASVKTTVDFEGIERCLHAGHSYGVHVTTETLTFALATRLPVCQPRLAVRELPQ